LIDRKQDEKLMERKIPKSKNQHSHNNNEGGKMFTGGRASWQKELERREEKKYAKRLW